MADSEENISKKKNARDFLKRGKEAGIMILNGIIGDRLHSQENPLSAKMAFYRDRKPVSADRSEIMKIYPDQKKKICILVHGLVSDEIMWNFPDTDDNYGNLLEKDFGFSSFYLRYNSGLHISENGKTLASLINDLLNSLPVPAEEIVFIGHSMGGLVVRSACHYAEKFGFQWTEKISRTFFLGSPHLGAPLEKFGNAVTTVLSHIPNPFTKLAKDIINTRSAGIKDLRFGYITDEDWKEKDPDRFLTNTKNPVPLLENVKYYIITGTMTEDPDSILSVWLGDSLVRKQSAKGESKNESHALKFLEEHHREFPGISHISLMRDERIYDQIRDWMQSD